VTTIACDGKVMAADGLVTNGNDIAVEFDEKKIWRLPDGSILGAAGSTDGCEAIRRFLSNADEKLETVAEFDAIRLMPDGSGLSYSDKGGEKSTRCTWPATLGTGGSIALGALLAGASPRRAVEIACQRDCGSGGKIRTLRRV
jgi:hypothetical protein